MSTLLSLLRKQAVLSEQGGFLLESKRKQGGSEKGRILRNLINVQAPLRASRLEKKYFFLSEHARVLGTPE